MACWKLASAAVELSEDCCSRSSPLSRCSSGSYQPALVVSTSVSASPSAVSPTSGCPIKLCDSFLRLPLVCQRPATQERTERPKLRESLFRREDDGGFGTLLGSTHLAT